MVNAGGGLGSECFIDKHEPLNFCVSEERASVVTSNQVSGSSSRRPHLLAAAIFAKEEEKALKCQAVRVRPAEYVRRKNPSRT